MLETVCRIPKRLRFGAKALIHSPQLFLSLSSASSQALYEIDLDGLSSIKKPAICTRRRTYLAASLLILRPQTAQNAFQPFSDARLARPRYY